MTFTRKVRRVGYLLSAAAFTLGLLSVVRPASASAYGLLSSRHIKMSSSAVGATNTDYSVQFSTVTAGQTLGSVVIDFCSNSPIIGDTCTAPTGFNTNYATLTLNNLTGNATGLSIDTTATTANASSSNRLLLTRTPGAVANGTITFDLGNGTSNGITNPTTTNSTYFARIATWTNADGTGAFTDAGGVALSTANVLNVTAKVQETLTFCVYTGLNCAAGGTDVRLGDSNGVLSSTSTTYTSNANYDLASNALGGVAVKLKGDTLTSGSFTIDPADALTPGVCSADTSSTAREQFGVRVATVGTGQTADAKYGCSANNHDFDVTNTNTLYGQNIATTAGATDSSTSTIELAAKASGTTEAGVYTTTLQLIATATY